MNLLKQIGTAVGVIVLLFLVIGVFLPAQRHLERAITINAPASAGFQAVNSLRKWENWSAWRDIDPNATVKYEGPEAGGGCTMSWASENPKVGKGAQQIVVSEPNRRLVISLNFVGWEGTGTAGWQFEEQAAGGTQVTWSHDSANKGGLLDKYMAIILYPKLGKSYAQGLQNLKAHVESLDAQQQAVQEEAAVAAPKER